jgi:hypothetical protein
VPLKDGGQLTTDDQPEWDVIEKCYPAYLPKMSSELVRTHPDAGPYPIRVKCILICQLVSRDAGYWIYVNWDSSLLHLYRQLRESKPAIFVRDSFDHERNMWYSVESVKRSSIPTRSPRWEATETVAPLSREAILETMCHAGQVRPMHLPVGAAQLRNVVSRWSPEDWTFVGVKVRANDRFA